MLSIPAIANVAAFLIHHTTIRNDEPYGKKNETPIFLEEDWSFENILSVTCFFTRA